MLCAIEASLMGDFSHAGWFSREINGLDYTLEQNQLFTEGNLGLGLEAGMQRGQTADRQASVLTYRYRISPTASVPISTMTALKDVTKYILPTGFMPFLGVNMQKGVTFYRRVEPGILDSALHVPLTPFSNIPKSADEVAPLDPNAKQIFPKGTTMDLPSTTGLSFGLTRSQAEECAGDLSGQLKDLAGQLAKSAAKNSVNPLDLVIQESLTLILSKNYSLTHQIILTRFEGPGEYARLQKVVAYSKSVQAELHFQIGKSLKTHFPFLNQAQMNDLANTLSSRVLKRVLTKVIGASVDFVFTNNKSEEVALWDYTYDLSKPAAREAFNQAYQNTKFAPEIAIKANSLLKRPQHDEIKEQFDDPFKMSYELSHQSGQASAIVPSVWKNFDGSFKRDSQEQSLSISLPFYSGTDDTLRAQSIIHTEGQAFSHGINSQRSSDKVPFINSKQEYTRLETVRMIDPEKGTPLDDATELKFTHQIWQRKIGRNAISDFADTVYQHVGGDSSVYPFRNGYRTSLSDKLNMVEQQSNAFPWGGTVAAEVVVSPTYLSLMRLSLMTGAEQNFGFSKVYVPPGADADTRSDFEGGSQGVLYKFIFNAVINHLYHVAERKQKSFLVVKQNTEIDQTVSRIKDLFMGTKTQLASSEWSTCALKLASKISIFMMHEHPTLAQLNRRLDFYKFSPNCYGSFDYEGLLALRDAMTESLPAKCQETYDLLTLPTIMDMIESLPQRPEWGRPVTTRISAFGKVLKSKKGQSDDFSFVDYEPHMKTTRIDQVSTINNLSGNAASAYSAVQLQSGVAGSSTCTLKPIVPNTSVLPEWRPAVGH